MTARANECRMAGGIVDAVTAFAAPDVSRHINTKKARPFSQIRKPYGA